MAPRTPFLSGLVIVSVLALAAGAYIVWPKRPAQMGPAELADDGVWFPGGGMAPAPYVEIDLNQIQLMARIEEKQRLVDALALGSISYAQAAEQFRILHQNDTTAIAHLRRLFPHAGDDELWFRQVLLFVKGQIPKDPTRLTELVNRLERELARLFPARKWPGRVEPVAPKLSVPNARGELIVGGGSRRGPTNKLPTRVQ